MIMNVLLFILWINEDSILTIFWVWAQFLEDIDVVQLYSKALAGKAEAAPLSNCLFVSLIVFHVWKSAACFDRSERRDLKEAVEQMV